MLFKRNSFQNVTFSGRIYKKKNNIFWLKIKRLLHLLLHHMVFVKSRKGVITKNWKRNRKFLPTWLSYFFEHVTPSAIPRRVFILLNHWGRPKNEPKFLNIFSILFNFNQFNNCPFFLTNYFLTLFSFLASKSS